MALIKADHILENVQFTFDAAGNVIDVLIQVTYVVLDDVTGVEETRVRKTVSVLSSLPPEISRIASNTFGRRVTELAKQA